jgi:hypothetical protein
MTNYDFALLNDKEFEAFVADLLSEELKVRIERFKPGKDAGVDGRWFSPDGGEMVLQCKHWLGSGCAALLKHLKEVERPKVDVLRPARYLIATSLPLSRKDKKKIAEVFAPYITSESDIWGQEDLNDALGRHADVERRNYKLWLSSINVVSFLLSRAILGRSYSELALFREEAELYVQTLDYERALAHLDERRVLILTGEPGIGKTTLARQLVLDYVKHGFSLAVIEESVSEAEQICNEEGKQIFYFDDFLGRIFLEALKAKQDSHITAFLQRIARDPNKRIILTSRTNILNRGGSLSDLLRSTHLLRSTYELELATLTTIDRARILYSHIWHSTLEPAYISELYSGRRYHRVINHPNFNPRLIAFILDSDKLGDIGPDHFWDYIERTLENPEDIWAHFFSAQLDQPSRDLVIITVLNGRKISDKDLFASFTALPPRNKEHAGAIHEQFNKAVHHTTGSVLVRQIEDERGLVSYSLINASIADYVLRYLSGSELWLYYYPRIRTLSALGYLQELRNEGVLDVERFDRVLRSVVDVEAMALHGDAYSLQLAGLLASNNELSAEYPELLQHWLHKPALDVIAVVPIPYIRMLINWRNFASKEEMLSQSPIIYNALFSMPVPIEEPKLLGVLLPQLEMLGLNQVAALLRDRILMEWGRRAGELVRNQNVLGDYLTLDDLCSAEETLKIFIRDSLSMTGLELSPAELEDLCDNVSVENIIEENIEIALREDWKADSWRYKLMAEREDASAVDDLFERDPIAL